MGKPTLETFGSLSKPSWRVGVAHPGSLSRVLLKVGLSFFFKKLCSPRRLDARTCVRAREGWKVHRQPRMGDNNHRLVFLNETATTTKMPRLRGRARRGTRLKADAPAARTRVVWRRSKRRLRRSRRPWRH
jgi:hypothetical protein